MWSLFEHSRQTFFHEIRSAQYHNHTLKNKILHVCVHRCLNIVGFRSGITGEGAQCDDLAEGNELIKTLQARSALSKDRYFDETLDTYNQHNFKGVISYHSTPHYQIQMSRFCHHFDEPFASKGTHRCPYTYTDLSF